MRAPALALLLATASHAQDASFPTLKQRTAEESRLTFDVICRTAAASPCPALLAGDLQVRVDGRRMRNETIGTQAEKPTAYFVLDAINTPQADLVRSQGEVLAVLRAMGPHLPVATGVLIVTDTRPHFRGRQPDSAGGWELIRDELYVTRMTPSQSGPQLANDLATYEPQLHRIGEAQASAGGSERVRISLQSVSFIAAALRTTPGAKTLLWIGPGWPQVHMTQGGLAGQVFDSIVYFDDLLRTSRVMLSALDPTGAATDRQVQADVPVAALRPGSGQSSGVAVPAPYQPGDAYRAWLAPARTARSADPNDMLLPVLALHSGGTVQTSSNDIRGGIERFFAEADALYAVSFPSAQVTAKGPFHSLEIRSDGPAKAALRTRTGFYAR